ncbi:MAG: hypothetical protein OEZ65_07880 [Gemmatimonadota bacterium]|nr:hypothetical protein [Gemmatimonadota bacterium]MDH5759495.1 hypothetical protein [Gemmatimonadota bacterium]
MARFSLAYAAAAFVLLQVAEIVFPAFGLGPTAIRILVVAVTLAFPPAAAAAWVFDFTADGIRRTEELPGGASGRYSLLFPRVAFLGVTLVSVGVLALWLRDQGVFSPIQVGSDATQEGGREVVLAAYDPEVPVRSLAVLPLDDLSAEQSEAYFVAGMHDELITRLSQIAGLRVVSRSAVMRYAGTGTARDVMGRGLRADAVIEGSIRREGDQVRITVHLIHAASGTNIWTKQYDRGVEQVLAVQSEVALDIARRVEARITPRESSALVQTASRSVRPEAQEAYLRGAHEMERSTPEGFRAAFESFSRAVEIDPEFAPAVAGMAGSRFLAGLADPAMNSTELELARRDAERAVLLDSVSQVALEVLSGITRTMHELDLPSGPAGSKGTSAPVRTATTRLGRSIEEMWLDVPAAKAGIPKAQLLQLTRGLMELGEFAEAAISAEDVVELDPMGSGAWELLVQAYMADGATDEAVSAVRRWAKTGANGAPDEQVVRAVVDGVASRGASGYWAALMEWLRMEPPGPDGASQAFLAAVRAGSGDVEGAIESLARAAAADAGSPVGLRTDPVWDPVRGDVRFARIVEEARRPPAPPER